MSPKPCNIERSTASIGGSRWKNTAAKSACGCGSEGFPEWETENFKNSWSSTAARKKSGPIPRALRASGTKPRSMPSFRASQKSISHPHARFPRFPSPIAGNRRRAGGLVSPRELPRRCFTVVGTRRATLDGRRAAREFSHAIAQAGVAVVSGMAAGIDQCAHEGALAAGKSVAVLGAGVDLPGSMESRELCEQILESGGALLSEYYPGTPRSPEIFPRAIES